VSDFECFFDGLLFSIGTVDLLPEHFTIHLDLLLSPVDKALAHMSKWDHTRDAEENTDY
jgi:hypothetical protein